MCWSSGFWQRKLSNLKALFICRVDEVASRSKAEELTGSKACDGDEDEGILKKKKKSGRINAVK